MLLELTIDIFFFCLVVNLAGNETLAAFEGLGLYRLSVDEVLLLSFMIDLCGLWGDTLAEVFLALALLLSCNGPPLSERPSSGLIAGSVLGYLYCA